MLVAKVMSSPVIWAKAATPIHEVAQRMRAHGVGTLPVFEGQTLIGIVTDRDLVIRALSRGVDPASTVARIVSHRVITCLADQDVAEAAALMGERQVRRLLVIDRIGAPVGILSVGDIAENVSEDLAGQVLGEISEARARDRHGRVRS